MKHRSSSLGIGVTSLFLSGVALGQPAPAQAPPGAAPAPAAPPAGAPPATDAPPGSVPVGPAAPTSPPAGTGNTPYYEQAPPPQTPPVIHVEQPPPPPLEPKTRHYHDGFYLRLSTGLGFQSVKSTASNTTGGDSSVSTSGAGFALDVLMGGTPTPGLVIGGGSVFQTAVSPGQSTGGPPMAGLDSQAPGGVGLWLIGPMIDVFPNPNEGFHLGALLGIGAIGLKGNDDKLSGGGGVSAWVGYGGWAAAQWSLGGLIRLTAAGARRTIGPSEIDVSDGAFGLTLEFSATYH